MFRLLVLCGLFAMVWEGAAAPRQLVACPTLRLKFGRIRYRQKGRLAKFNCNTGYLTAGEKYSTCHNGVWDSPPPKCVRASCMKVNPPINGLIYPSHRGAVLNFFCKPGFELRGPNTTYCDGKSWDNKLPSCIASHSKPALRCDFESTDLCGWNHDIQHDFDWTRMNLRTPSGHLGTGPSFDHTKGESQDGYYMYIESSSRNENDTARLISPIYDKMNQDDVCLEFYYHMHGSSTGELRVYLKKESDSWELKPRNAIFWRAGNHGNQWLRSINRIGPISENFQIIIEGVRGSSYFSDIAIDDVSIIQNCVLDEVTTESDVTYTAYIEEFEAHSCYNRCYETSSDDVCGCDDSCFENDTCCQDFIALCGLGFTDEFETGPAEDTTEEPTFSTAEPSPTPAPVLKYSTRSKPREITSNEIAPPATKQTNTSTSAPNKKAYTPTIEIKATSSLPKNTIFLTTKQFMYPPTKKFVSPPTKKPTKKPPIPPPRRKPAPPVISRITTQPIVRPKENEPRPIDDVVTVPVEVQTDNTFFAIKEDTTRRVVYNFAPAVIKTQKIVIDEPPLKAKGIILGISVVAVAVLVVAGVLLVRRRRLLTCRNRMRGGGSSQSDVRFLTSDEILDFNLMCPDD